MRMPPGDVSDGTWMPPLYYVSAYQPLQHTGHPLGTIPRRGPSRIEHVLLFRGAVWLQIRWPTADGVYYVAYCLVLNVEPSPTQ